MLMQQISFFYKSGTLKRIYSLYRRYSGYFSLVLPALFLLFAGCKEPSKPDMRPPRVSIIQPEPGAMIEQITEVVADASDNRTLEKVVFLLDEKVIAEDYTIPYSFSWYTAFWADDSEHTLRAVAVDEAANESASKAIAVTVSKKAAASPVLLYPPNDAVISNRRQIPLFWHPQTDAAYYTVAVARDTNFTEIVFSNTTPDTAILTTSLDIGKYHWIVVAQNSFGLMGAWSYYRSFDIEAPPAPQLLTPSQNYFFKSTDSLSFSWHSVPNAVQYQFQIKSRRNPKRVLYEQTLPDTFLTLLPMGEHWHQWSVRSINQGGLSGEWSPSRNYFFSRPEILQFVTVPSGEYLYGPNAVTKFLEYDFEIMKYPVTCEQYLLFLNQAYSKGKVDQNGFGDYPGDEFYPAGRYRYLDISIQKTEHGDIRFGSDVGYFVLDREDFKDHPIADVSWFGAFAFAQWYGLTLPDEFEWEKTARDYSSTEFPWGDDIRCENANIAGCNPRGLSNGTTPVGYYNGAHNTIDSPSPYGAYDMCGNVWEWTNSWFGQGFADSRVIKGGSYSESIGTETGLQSLSAWYRFPRKPGEFNGKANSGIGFRCTIRINQELPDDFLE